MSNMPAPAKRSTEGTRGTVPGSMKRRGRPAGSKNKAKSILPTELANTMLVAMKDALPPDHYEYIRGVIKDGNAISTKRELDTLILLLSRNLYPALVMESLAPQNESDDEDFFDDDDAEDARPSKPKSNGLKMPVFRKDVTERLKVLQSLLAMKEKNERGEAEAGLEKPILKIVGGSGLDASRLRILVGVESGPMAGNADETAQLAAEARTVSDSVPERPVNVPAGEQG